MELKSNTWGEESACQSWEAEVESKKSGVGRNIGKDGVCMQKSWQLKVCLYVKSPNSEVGS